MNTMTNYRGVPVESLQTMLRQISSVDARVLPLIPSGYYDSNTYASVFSFQEAYGISPNGETDLNTWNAIVSAHNAASRSLRFPVLLPRWSGPIQPGQSNLHLYLVQAMLIALSHRLSIPRPDMTGVLDGKTQDALRFIQAISGSEPTGVLDSAAWNDLSSLYRITIGSG